MLFFARHSLRFMRLFTQAYAFSYVRFFGFEIRKSININKT